jgi:hypothetical protein
MTIVLSVFRQSIVNNHSFIFLAVNFLLQLTASDLLSCWVGLFIEPINDIVFTLVLTLKLSIKSIPPIQIDYFINVILLEQIYFRILSNIILLIKSLVEL